MKVVNMIDHQDYHNGPGIDYAGSTGCYLGIECLENTQDVLKISKNICNIQNILNNGRQKKMARMSSFTELKPWLADYQARTQL